MLNYISKQFVKKEEINALDQYKYAGRDYSLLGNYLLRHYWDYMLKLFPMWMAPNLITIIGFCFVIADYILVAVMIPDLEKPAPSWVYFVLSINIWLYLTFDNIDGRQARRTKTSSPLGELFDHGCDAISSSMLAIVQIAATGGGTDHIHLIIPICLLTGFYMSTWETWHVGGLILGYINGATEGIVTMCISMIITGIYGVDIWKTRIQYPLNLGYDIKLYELLYAALILLLFIYQIPSCLISVYKSYKHDTERHHKAPAIFTYLVHLFPMALYAASYIAWVTSPFSNIWGNHLFLFALTNGIVFGRIATKILLARITKSSFPKPTIALIPLVIGACCANFIPTFHLYEKYYLYAYFLFTVINYALWATVVIHSFCRHLKIRCLSIPVKHD